MANGCRSFGTTRCAQLGDLVQHEDGAGDPLATFIEAFVDVLGLISSSVLSARPAPRRSWRSPTSPTTLRASLVPGPRRRLVRAAPLQATAAAPKTGDQTIPRRPSNDRRRAPRSPLRRPRLSYATMTAIVPSGTLSRAGVPAGTAASFTSLRSHRCRPAAEDRRPPQKSFFFHVHRSSENGGW